jgi:hypothetical protein
MGEFGVELAAKEGDVMPVEIGDVVSVIAFARMDIAQHGGALQMIK